MVGQALVILFIALKLLFMIAFYRACYLFIVVVFTERAVHDKKVSILLYLLCINWGKVAFAERQVMYGIQQIGFTRTIIAGKGVNTLAEGKFSFGVVFKIDDG